MTPPTSSSPDVGGGGQVIGIVWERQRRNARECGCWQATNRLSHGQKRVRVERPGDDIAQNWLMALAIAFSAEYSRDYRFEALVIGQIGYIK
jgi:hypothetical protein